MNPNLFTRPNKPTKIRVTKRERLGDLKKIDAPKMLAVDKDTQCFVTPRPVAERMADYLDAENGHSILEPSAGTGNLLDALDSLGIDGLSIVAVEKNIQLAQRLFKRGGCYVSNKCFLDWAENTQDQFDRILMNPPFSRSDAKNHVGAALSLLKTGGRLIALVPVNFKHDDAYEIEVLQSGTFESTAITTKIIEIEK